MSVFGTLLLWRLRFYAITTMALLRRRSQATLFLLFMLAPAAAPFMMEMRLLSTPVLALIHTRDPLHAVAIWMALLLTFFIWSGAQNKAVRGGEAQAFLDTLPFNPRLRLWLDISVLIVVDIPILLPFIAGLLFGAPALTPFETVQQALLVVSFAIFGIFLQAWLLRGTRGALGLAAASFISPLLLTITHVPMLAILPVLVIAYAASKLAKRLQARPATTVRDTPSSLRLSACSTVQVNFLRLSLRYLFGKEALTNRLDLLICSLMPALLMHSAGLRPTIMIALQIMVLVLLVFQLGGVAFAIRRLHAPMASYWRTHGLCMRDLDYPLILTLLVVTPVVCLPLFIALGCLSG